MKKLCSFTTSLLYTVKMWVHESYTETEGNISDRSGDGYVRYDCKDLKYIFTWARMERNMQNENSC